MITMTGFRPFTLAFLMALISSQSDHYGSTSSERKKIQIQDKYAYTLESWRTHFGSYFFSLFPLCGVGILYAFENA